jgi:hypothetical protein
LRLAGIDVDFAKCWMDVSGNKTKLSRDEIKANKKNTSKQNVSGPYSEQVLEAAMISAMTKYDSLEVYFTRDERSVIKDNLKDELRTDLKARSKPETQAVETFVSKRIGVAFGQWSKTSKEGTKE